MKHYLIQALTIVVVVIIAAQIAKRSSAFAKLTGLRAASDATPV
jgi:hypothetical protein